MSGNPKLKQGRAEKERAPRAPTGKGIKGALGEELSPEQRVKLAQNIEAKERRRNRHRSDRELFSLRRGRVERRPGMTPVRCRRQ